MREAIFHFLSTRGLDISEMRGTNLKNRRDFPEYYWALNLIDSNEFLDLCAEEFIPVIGGDIIRIIGDGEMIFDDTHWFYDRTNGECFKDYLDHSIHRAKEYLRYFSHDSPVFFSFTLDKTSYL